MILERPVRIELTSLAWKAKATTNIPRKHLTLNNCFEDNRKQLFKVIFFCFEEKIKTHGVNDLRR